MNRSVAIDRSPRLLRTRVLAPSGPGGSPGSSGGAGAGTGGPASRGPQRRRRPLIQGLPRRIYAFFYNKAAAIGIILAMAFFTLVGTMIEQSPLGVRDDAEAYASWVDRMRPRFGGWTDVIHTLGFFHVFQSMWFQVTTIMLTLSIIACTTHRAPQLWQRAMRPLVHPSDNFFARAGLRAEIVVPGTPEQALTRVEQLLGRHKYRIVTDAKDPERSCYADRFRYAPFSTFIAHTAFVVILVGVFVTSAFGFRLDEFPITVGQSRDVGQNSGLTIEARSFTDSYHPDGQPMDFVSDLVLYENGQQVARQDVRVNSPLRYNGVTVYQTYFGISAIVKITDPASGAVLFEGGVPLQYKTDDERHVFGSITLPPQGLKYWVISAASGRTDALVAPGQAQIDAVRIGEDKRMDSGVLDAGSTTRVAGLDVGFQRERQFTGLSVAHDRGDVIVWVGAALMSIGFFLTFFVKHRRLWVRVRPVEGSDETPGSQPYSRVVIASGDRHDLGYEGRFRRMVAQLCGTQPAPTADPHPVHRS